MFIPQGLRRKLLFIAATTMIAGAASPTVANSTVTYGYDLLGRVTNALYDNGVCIAYTYDPNGNRTAQTNTFGSAQWGSGIWGCFQWTP